MYKVQINHYDGYVVTVHTFSTIEAAMECHKEFALANQVMEDALTRRIQTGDVKEYNELYEKFGSVLLGLRYLRVQIHKLLSPKSF
jgi:hypothetical protein